jgi:branched-chain amino acid transport system substrate-binding protein
VGLSCLFAALTIGVAACGSSKKSSGGGGGGGKSLTIYSSLPLQGASRPQSEDVIKGEKLALKQHGNKAGSSSIKYVSLDDATAQAGKWDPGQTSSNARKAAQDKSAIAYLGEFNSGASAISIPILNEAGILQISPSNTALGLTKAGAGASKGEPQKYYPAGTRTYGRVVPIDTIQGAAQAQYMKDNGVTKLYVLDDKEVYGVGVAKNTQASAQKAGIAIAGTDSWDPKAANYRALASKIKASGADAVFIGGIIDNNAVQLAKDIFAAAPTIKQFGPDGVATTDYAKGIPAGVAKVSYLTAPTVAPNDLPPAGQKFYKDFQATYGTAPADVNPYAVYGYEAMSVALDSIAKGNADRKATIAAFFATKNRSSPLGVYDIDKDGDTTLTNYGSYRVKGGKLVFDKVIKAAGA